MSGRLGTGTWRDSSVTVVPLVCLSELCRMFMNYDLIRPWVHITYSWVVVDKQWLLTVTSPANCDGMGTSVGILKWQVENSFLRLHWCCSSLEANTQMLSESDSFKTWQLQSLWVQTNWGSHIILGWTLCTLRKILERVDTGCHAATDAR